MSWYSIFILCVIALRLVATPKDRNALSIVLVASFVSTLLVHLVTHQIHAPWKLVVPGMVETFTIIAMLQWSRNLTGLLNSGLLCIAWLDHLFCYLDVWLKTDMVYSRYETIIAIVAVGQLLTFHDTMLNTVGRIYRWFLTGPSGYRGVPAASVCVELPSSAGDKGLQKV